MIGTGSRHWLQAAVLAAVTLCLLWLWLFLSFTADDSFITFRYGRNLIEHGVWNWNPAGPRAEAYTSGLYGLLSIIPAALGLPPALLFKLLGIGAFALTLQRLHHFGGRPALLFGVVLAAFTPFLFVHLASGLETPVFILLMVEIASRLLTQSGRQGAFYALLLLLPFTRPEGAAFSAMAGVLFVHRIGWRQVDRVAFGVALTCGLVYFVGRWFYFGEILPTPFFAKAGFNLADLSANLQAFRLYLVFAAALFLLVRDWRYRLLLAIQLGIVLLLYAPAHLQMNFADRFALQALLPLALVAPVAMLAAKAGSGLPSRKRLMALALMGLMAGLGNVSQGAVTWLVDYTGSAVHAHRALGLALAPFKGRGYTIALADSGMIAYHGGWRAIDLVGLADIQIARNGNSLAYMEAAQPDVIVLYSNSGRPGDIRQQGFGHEAAGEFLQQHPQWKLSAAIPWNNDYWLMVFVRGDLPDAAVLAATLRQVEADAVAWSGLRYRHHLFRALSLRDAALP